jgi:hypothetical protein
MVAEEDMEEVVQLDDDDDDDDDDDKNDDKPIEVTKCLEGVHHQTLDASILVVLLSSVFSS